MYKIFLLTVILILITILIYLLCNIKKNNSESFNKQIDNKKIEKIIYIFWTGNNPLTKNRKDGIITLKNITGVDIRVINTHNLKDYILKDYPLHPGYRYLSRIHKSDYLRCYFMHHYGGGYSDIKKQTGSWVKYFDKINSNPNIWMIGVGGLNPPSKSFDIAFPEEYNSKQRSILKSYHSQMVSVSFFICRPRTTFTYEWYNLLNQRLDYYYNELKRHPAIFSRESKDRLPSKYYNDEKDPQLIKLGCPKEKTKYPITWNRILGQIVYPLQAKYISHIKYGLPPPYLSNYT